MKTASIIWRVITNLITLGVVLSIFSIASGNFETVILSILVLIYLSVWTFSALWGLHTIEFGEALNNEFKSIRRLLNKNEPQEYNEITDILGIMGDIKSTETEEEKQERIERKQKKDNLFIKFYINVGFQTIIYFITLYHLFVALEFFN